MSSFHPSSLSNGEKKATAWTWRFFIKKLLAQANGIRNLRALVATQSGDTHLRHDLPWWNPGVRHPGCTILSAKRYKLQVRPFSQLTTWFFFVGKKSNSLHQLQFLHHFCPGENDERGSTSNQPERISIFCSFGVFFFRIPKNYHGRLAPLTSWRIAIIQSDLSFRIYEIYMSLNCVHIGGDGDAVSLFMFYFYTPED